MKELIFVKTAEAEAALSLEQLLKWNEQKHRQDMTWNSATMKTDPLLSESSIVTSKQHLKHNEDRWQIDFNPLKCPKPEN